MGLNIRFDAKAVDDIAHIRDYLIERSPQGAERVRLHILAAINRLADYPFLGRPTDAPNVRVLTLTRYPYLVFTRCLNRTLSSSTSVTRLARP